MASKKIPYEQALKLSQWLATFNELNAVVQQAQQRLERLRAKLIGAGEFADIPLDGKGLEVKLEPGPDKHGLVAVEWKEPDDAPAN